MKALLLGVISGALPFALLASTDIPLVESEWFADPLTWTFDGKRASIRNGTIGMAVSARPRYRKLTVEAEITPKDAVDPEFWAVFGPAIVDDADNHWYMALVQRPSNLGGGHTFELGEIRCALHGANLRENLPIAKDCFQAKGARWDFGRRYRIRLSLDAEKAVGEVYDAEGRLLIRRGCLLAGKPAVTQGRVGFKQIGTFSVDIGRVSYEGSGEVVEKDVPDTYRSDDFVEGVTGRATGFFRVEKREKNRWWMFDPLGRGVFIRGVDHVNYDGPSCWKRPGWRPLREAFDKKFGGDREKWADWAAASLREWGFNLVAGSVIDPALRKRGFIYAQNLMIGEEMALGDVNSYISRNGHAPNTAFPNVFHPKFAERCRYVAQIRCQLRRNDPYLLGWYIDNELAWGRRECLGTWLFDTAAQLPEDHAARRALVKLVTARGRTVETATDDDKVAYLAEVAERYFAATTAAIREADPHHLILGCRFAGRAGVHPVVWAAVGRHCDVLSFNFYPWADLKRNFIAQDMELPDVRVTECFAERNRLAGGLPTMITEWSFPALDAGLPCTNGAGQRMRTQRQRECASALYMRTMLSLPFIVGYSYFTWVDEPPLGITEQFPEDSNYGLINLNGEPYNLVNVFKLIQTHVKELRFAPPPREREAPPAAPLFFGKKNLEIFRSSIPAGSRPVSFVRKDNAFAISNACGLEVSGAVGRGRILRSVRLNGKEIGMFSSMLQLADCKKCWPEEVRVLKADWKPAVDGSGTLTVLSEAESEEYCFRMTHELTFAPDRPDFFVRLVSISNERDTPIKTLQSLFRPYAAFAVDESLTPKAIPFLYEGERGCSWVSADGLRYGLSSTSTKLSRSRFYLNPRNGVQHPDNNYTLRAEIAPRQTMTLPDEYWAVVKVADR